MANNLQQGAAGGGSDAFGQNAPFLLKIGELDFDQFMERQLLFHAGEKGVAHALMPHFEHRVEQLRFAFEAATVGGCQGRLQETRMIGFPEEFKNGKGATPN